MIIGRGLIGGKLSEIDNQKNIFFASGVSNSKCTDENEFKREFNLLSNYKNVDKKFIYFSSVHEYITNPQYLNHKKKIESYIENNINDYIIVRLPQIIGKNGNETNLINFLFKKIIKNQSFDLFETKRSLLDIDDLIKIVKFLTDINYKGYFDINYIELSDVIEFVKIIENCTKKEAKIKSLITYNINIVNNSNFVNSVIERFIETTNYNKKVIEKYLNNRDYYV